MSHRPGERNGVLELTRRAGVWGHLAPTKRLPAEFFAPDLSADVAANLIFGLLESDGYVTREQTGGLRVGFTTTSEQLAEQIHWLLLRWGIGSSVRPYDPTQRRPSVIAGRVGAAPSCRSGRSGSPGIDNVELVHRGHPDVGPAGSGARGRSGQAGAAPSPWVAAQLSAVLPDRAGALLPPMVEASPPSTAASIVGCRRPHRVACARCSGTPVCAATECSGSPMRSTACSCAACSTRMSGTTGSRSIGAPEWADVYDIEVDEHHTFVANDVVISNCAPPSARPSLTSCMERASAVRGR